MRWSLREILIISFARFAPASASTVARISGFEFRIPICHPTDSVSSRTRLLLSADMVGINNPEVCSRRTRLRPGPCLCPILNYNKFYKNEKHAALLLLLLLLLLLFELWIPSLPIPGTVPGYRRENCSTGDSTHSPSSEFTRFELDIHYCITVSYCVLWMYKYTFFSFSYTELEPKILG